MTCQLANVLSSVLAAMATNATETPSAPAVKVADGGVAEVRQAHTSPRPRKVSLGAGRYVEFDRQPSPSRNQR
ncbi:MAG: hypothetical protein EG825_17895 [Rhodocyclaceae bacterium]|nr:hypothetical protein [Rhodocyclaceae bacterium]